MAHPTGIQYYGVFEPNNDVGYVYSYNNGGPDRPEFLALNVPRCKPKKVAGTINFLATREIKHGEAVQCGGLDFLTNKIEGERKAQLLQTHMTATDPRSPIFELVPRFDYDNPEDWGSRPAAPGGRQDLVNAIIDAWKEDRGTFILYVDGNPGNCSLGNLKQVDLCVALRHVKDWKVDWDSRLTSEQADFVREHNRYFSKLAKVYFRSKEVCAGCGLIEVGRLMRCQRCKNQWYCGADCQRQDWPNHRKWCKILQAQRNNRPEKSR